MTPITLRRCGLTALAFCVALGGCDDGGADTGPAGAGGADGGSGGRTVGAAGTTGGGGADAAVWSGGGAGGLPGVGGASGGAGGAPTPTPDAGPAPAPDAGPVIPVEFDDVIVGGAPDDAPDRFDGAPEAGCGPTLVYPEPGTAFPANIRGVEFQWDGNGHELFRMRLTGGAGTTVTWYTDGGAITPDGREWQSIRSAARGRTLRLELAGIGARGETVCVAPEAEFEIDTTELKGAIYYWSTGDFGIMRLALEEENPAPEAFLTQATAPQINCPACHALSRDGTRIAFTRTTFPPFGHLAASAVQAPTDLFYDPNPNPDPTVTVDDVNGYFPSFAPDSRRVVAGRGGRLPVIDIEDGADLFELPLPRDQVGVAPDWSWQGDRIVAAVGPSSQNFAPDVGINRGGLGEWVLEDGLWTGPEMILPVPGGNGTLDRPAYSPDGLYIVFNRSGASGGQGMSNSSADLELIPVGSDQPIPLDRANRGGGLGNSWPKWAPNVGNGRQWVAFSSLRDYGNRLRQGAEPTPQLWVTGIDPNAVDAGEDPSSPAFWLPFQALGSGNHIPYWAVFEKD
jgi:hypothetical protein